jgi:hypothetical protein
MTDNERLPASCLLWLRNHYDVGRPDNELKAKVIERVDRVLAGCAPFTPQSRPTKVRWSLTKLAAQQGAGQSGALFLPPDIPSTR